MLATLKSSRTTGRNRNAGASSAAERIGRGWVGHPRHAKPRHAPTAIPSNAAPGFSLVNCYELAEFRERLFFGGRVKVTSRGITALPRREREGEARRSRGRGEKGCSAGIEYERTFSDVREQEAGKRVMKGPGMERGGVVVWMRG